VAQASPDHARIRSYNVGFGDCYLLTFSYPRGRDRNVLIDFGSTESSGFMPKGGLLTVAEQIRADCGGSLEMVVATHRHADHISGFGRKPGEIIRSLDPDIVLQPWTERPDLDPAARAPAANGATLRARTMVSRLSDLQHLAEAVAHEVPKLRASGQVSKTVADQLSFLGETNLKNAPAVTNLMTMGGKRIYANFGTKVPVSRLLPGVKLDVLGPPTLKQSAAIAGEAQVDPMEFWHLAALRAAAARSASSGTGRVFPRAPVARSVSQEARWVMPQIDKMRAEEMLAIVRILDGVLNNTSLILTFQVGDTLLLFPGDAQIENWRYTLFECDDADEIRERLKKAAFYKVGHHGSLNATPKTLWNGFAHRGGAPTADRLRTMVSTLAGKHGSEARSTEVPRRTLVEALRSQSDFRTTQDIRSKKEFWVDVDFDL
jgi:hypothetical protein